MAKLERIYTVPLGEAYEAVRNKRVPRAVKMLKAFASRHMKADGERVLVSEALNKHLWAKSIMSPPKSVKVRMIKEGDSINIYLADEKIEPKKEASKEDKSKKDSKEEKAAPKKEEDKESAAKKPEPAKKAGSAKEEKK